MLSFFSLSFRILLDPAHIPSIMLHLLNGLNLPSILYLVSFILISIPLIIYCGFDLYRSWTDLWLNGRRRSLILFVYIIIVISICLWTLKAMEEQIPSLRMIVNPIDILLQWIGVLLFNTRVWLLYCDYHYARILAASSWQVIISPISITNNWFLLNRRRLGDHIYILKYIVLPIAITRSALYIFTDLSHFIDHMVVNTLNLSLFMLLCVCSIIFMVSVWSRYPQFEDPYFIRHELKMTFMMMAVAVILIIGTIILWMFYGSPWQWTFVVAQFTLCLFMYLMIVYPKRKLMDYNTRITKRVSLQKRITLEVVHDVVRMEWEELIATKHGFESFANFLAEQFSVEVWCI